MTDVFYAIGDFSQWVFRGMKHLGHWPNLFLWVFIFIMLVYQTRQIIKQTKEADKNGTLR
ncbi:MAG: hypothetical protein V4506_15880 [Bacteroidota bacterium]